MVQPVADWSETLHGVPAINGFLVRFESTQVRLQPLSGAGRFYQRQAEVLLTIDMSVPQTKPQFENFVAFWELDLKRGREAFNISLYVGPQKENVVATIVDGYNYNILGRHDSHAVVRMKLEGYRAASDPFVGPEVVYVVAGSPETVTPDDDQIRAGYPYDPADPSVIVYGGDYIGRPYS